MPLTDIQIKALQPKDKRYLVSAAASVKPQ
jgi:hypothetical protein